MKILLFVLFLVVKIKGDDGWQTSGNDILILKEKTYLNLSITGDDVKIQVCPPKVEKQGLQLLCYKSTQTSAEGQGKCKSGFCFATVIYGDLGGEKIVSNVGAKKGTNDDAPSVNYCVEITLAKNYQQCPTKVVNDTLYVEFESFNQSTTIKVLNARVKLPTNGSKPTTENAEVPIYVIVLIVIVIVCVIIAIIIATLWIMFPQYLPWLKNKINQEDVATAVQATTNETVKKESENKTAKTEEKK
uniref:Allorecognition 2 n=1 Tax=Panagrolaimus sp. JU765 TaxID=591449 RepID=A0AC34Q3M5_9BILA